MAMHINLEVAWLVLVVQMYIFCADFGIALNLTQAFQQSVKMSLLEPYLKLLLVVSS